MQTSDALDSADTTAGMHQGTGSAVLKQKAQFFVDTMTILAKKDKADGGGSRLPVASLVRRTGETGAKMLVPRVGAAPSGFLISGDTSCRISDTSDNSSVAQANIWDQVRLKMRWAIPFLKMSPKVHPAEFPMKSMLSHFAPSRFQKVCSWWLLNAVSGCE